MSLIARINKRFSARVIAVVAGAVVMLGLAGGAALAAVVGHNGTTVTRVAILTQDTAAIFTSSAWTNVGSLSIYAGQSQLIDVTYTAESACSGSSGWCSVRVLVDGVEADPVVGTDFAFNEAEGPASWESHSVERVRAVSFTGFHSVVVQTAQVGGTTHRLDDWTLRALAIAQ
jgi:hypothetical protein